MIKQGNKYLAIIVVFTLAIHLLCIHEAAGVKSLNVTVLVHHVEVDVGGTVNVTVRYENTGDEALDLKLTIFDEGDNPSSPRPVLTYDSYQISALLMSKMFILEPISCELEGIMINLVIYIQDMMKTALSW